MRQFSKEHRVASAIALMLCYAPGGAVFAQDAANAPAPQWVSAAVSGARLQHRTFESRAARTRVSFHIYTPEIYDTERDRRKRSRGGV